MRKSSVAEKYNIMSIPTLLLFKRGECVAKSVGFISEGQVMELLVNTLIQPEVLNEYMN